MFSFPSRHRHTDATFSSQFLSPTGLHPTLQLRTSSNESPVLDAECAPYVYLTLPKTIFADRYQLADELFLASKNLTALRYSTLPVDLEAPAYTTAPWGSNILLQMAPPEKGTPESWTAEIPLHLRYLRPSQTGEVTIEIPYPAVFWACESSDALGSATNPFDRTGLGYDGLFSPSTAFWHMTPAPEVGDRLVIPVAVPVLNSGGIGCVGLVTSAAFSLGFLWVLWRLAAAYVEMGQGAVPLTTAGKKDDESKKNQ